MNKLKLLTMPRYIFCRRFESIVMKGRFIRHTPKPVTPKFVTLLN